MLLRHFHAMWLNVLATDTHYGPYPDTGYKNGVVSPNNADDGRKTRQTAMMPNTSLQPAPVGAFSSAFAVDTAVPAWLNSLGASDMQPSFRKTGGARIGWANASWPLAQLSATQDKLTITARLLGTYAFTPEQVSAVERYVTIPVLAWGVRMRHCVPDYPQRIIFWSFRSPEGVLGGIRDRSVGEIRLFLLLLASITAMLLVVFTILLANGAFNQAPNKSFQPTAAAPGR